MRVTGPRARLSASLKTSTGWAPWHLVEGDSKRYARVKVLETVVAAAEAGLERHGRVAPPG